jgi:hypothetical protein
MDMRSRLTLALAALALLATSAVALNKLPPQGEEEVVHEIRPVTIWVVDADVEPVASAEVRLHPLRSDLRGTVRGERITDGLGIATFEEVPVGRWAVSVRGENHRYDGVEFDVPPSGDPPLVEVLLFGLGRVSGRVVNSEGAPTEGVSVVARHIFESDRAFRALDFHSWDRTDAEGRFDLSGLLWGEHRIMIWANQVEDLVVDRSQSHTHVMLTEETSEINLSTPFVADRLGERIIRGQVVDTVGQPVANAEVFVMRGGNRIDCLNDRVYGGLIERSGDQPRFTTDAHGRFAVYHSMSDQYVGGIVASTEDDRLAVVDLQDTTSWSGDPGWQTLMLTEPVMVQGRVAQDQVPYHGGSVVAHVQTSPPASSRGVIHIPPRDVPPVGVQFFWAANPDLEGRFEIGPIPRGITVQIRAFGHSRRGEVQVVEIPMSGDSRQVEIELQPPVRPHQLVVHVIDAVTEEPLPDAHVTGTGITGGAPIIGLLGEPVLLYYADWHPREHWIGAEAEGYSMLTIEGIPAEPWVEPVRPSMDRPPHRGWRIPLPPEDMTEVRILMTRE